MFCFRKTTSFIRTKFWIIPSLSRSKFFTIFLADPHTLASESCKALSLYCYFWLIPISEYCSFKTLVSSEGFTAPQKSLFSHTFSWDSSLFFVLNEWRQFRQLKLLLCFDIIPLNNADSVFLLKSSAIFLCFELLKEQLVFHAVGYVLKRSQDVLVFSHF